MEKDIWKKKLTQEEYSVLRDKGTERSFTGDLLHNKKRGEYACKACGNTLFSSETKFDSGTGWPSFYDAKAGAVRFKEDNSHGMQRIEVTCTKCGSHLGHLFNDSSEKTGNRYCINSVCLRFKENKAGKQDKA